MTIEQISFNSGDCRYIDIKNNKPLTIKVESDDLIGTTVKLPDVNADYVTLLVKKNQSDLRYLNMFITSELNHQCYFALPERWNGYY